MINYHLILAVNYSDKQWSLSGDLYDGLNWLDSSPKPTQDELDALWQSTQDAIAKKDCKIQAKSILQATDWATIPDVADSVNSPYLSNQNDFIVYRNAIRKLAVNPEVNPTWPTEPQPVWA